jgi:diguanylate cyclase (GGDEF)-like protein/PAS domain S-box-containing protein
MYGGALALLACSLLVIGLLNAKAVPVVSMAPDAAILAIALGMLCCLRTGHERWAAWMLIWGVWSACSVRLPLSGGLASPLVLAYPMLIALATLVRSASGTHAVALATALVAVVVAVFHVSGTLAEPVPEALLFTVPYVSTVLAVLGAAALRDRVVQRREVVLMRRQLRELRMREGQWHTLRRAVDKHPDGVVITDKLGRIEYVNDAYVRRAGWRRDEALGHLSAVRSNNGLSIAQRASMNSVLARGERWTDEVNNFRRGGETIVESVTVVPVRSLSGDTTHFVEYKEDITELRRATEEMRRLSRFDPLTGLPNRQWLLERLYIVRAGDGHDARPRVLLLIDIDRFTNFNELYGIDTGDRLLRVMATRLRRLAGEGGAVARIAADEFAVLLADVDADPRRGDREARSLAEAFLIEVQRPLELDDEPVSVTLSASVGATLFPGKLHDTPQAALGRAGIALRRARLAGDGRLAMFEPSMAQTAVRRSQLEDALRRGIPAGELQLYLQLQVRQHGDVAGAEVLVRWHHPQEGLLSPAAFLPVAEASDLILSLDRWVLAQACLLQLRLKAEGRRMRLSVNVSARHFQQPDFADAIIDLLDRTGADPGLLTLELNENVLVADPDDVLAKIHRLSALGIEFALDDFGTGFSSLSYLKRMPIHEIKIDRYFVQDAPVDAAGASLLESILRVAHSYGLRVVAEGVETAEQARFLRDRVPEIVCQGFLFHRPTPAADWLDLVGDSAEAASA